jgi:molybdopterin synthase catalytic subunit
MVDEPVNQAYIEGLEQSQATNFATAMQNLSRDSRGALPIAMGMERQAAKDRLDILDLQDTAKTAALKNLATAEGTAEQSDVDLAMKEASGLQEELSSAVEQKAQGAEGIMSGFVQGLQYGDDQGWFSGEEDEETVVEEGGKVKAEEGATTPDEFSHETNPIDIVQDGEKIGEMTGDEIIMPPDDRAQIEELMAKGSGEELIALLKELFSKYDSNVIEGKDQEAPMQEEEQQAPVMNEGGYLAKIKNRLKINF